jgi:hypothetical protein
MSAQLILAPRVSRHIAGTATFRIARKHHARRDSNSRPTGSKPRVAGVAGVTASARVNGMTNGGISQGSYLLMFFAGVK